jgi:hypothetical protein
MEIGDSDGIRNNTDFCWRLERVIGCDERGFVEG